MGLTNHSVGSKALDTGISFEKQNPSERIIALAGNPNVGKSTIFNGLTGMHQHTGNWTGKTVTTATGYYYADKNKYMIVDLPGTYSLLAHSAEETVARDFICFQQPDAVIVVCDATCLERNLNLVLQTLEITDKVVICVNLLDEARRKNIHIDLKTLSKELGVPVIGTVARNKNDLKKLMKSVETVLHQPTTPITISYPKPIETAISQIEDHLKSYFDNPRFRRWLAIKLLDDDPSLTQEFKVRYGEDSITAPIIQQAKENLATSNISAEILKDKIVYVLMKTAENICKKAVTYEKNQYHSRDRKWDAILTNKVFGYPIMLLLLAGILWLTIIGANYPSALLSDSLFWVQDRLTDLFHWINAPNWLHGALVLGVYRVLAWVISVMLPPMAIFFPLFTLLEDVGYLPRIAYNLDKPFQRCCACGKQALTMCMGFGCNAAGVVGCRIIDSPRERLLAILTNNFVPCNGRFPTLIALLTMFIIGGQSGFFTSLYSAALLTLIILLGIIVTFGITKLLSATILKGIPSSFTLELPPYRRPQIGKVIWRSLWDRTAFVLGRAAAVAAPTGLIVWLMANIRLDNISILQYCADFLDPFAHLLGLDGIILMAFILGFPANEIVIPIIIMSYMSTGYLTDISDLTALKQLFLQNGWTVSTAISMMLFSLFHWPCSTTLLTIKKETGSVKWTVLAALIPTTIGILLCMLFTAFSKLFLFT